MSITVGQEGAVTVVRLSGPIITGELEELEKNLEQLNQNGTQRIVIDMTEVVCLDSAGLELLYRHQKRLDERGLKLKLCGLNEIAQKIFEITRLARYFEIYANSAGAVRSFL